MLEKTLKRAVRGFFMGIAIGYFISIISTMGKDSILSDAFVQRIGNHHVGLLIHMLLTGLDGAICMAGMGFYDIERWPMIKSALLHWLLCIVVYIPISLYLDWFKVDRDLLIMLGMMTIAYVITWVIIAVSYRSEVKKINVEIHTNLR